MAVPKGAPSLDEIIATRGASIGGNVAKAYAAPASWDEASKSAIFVMTTQAEDRYRDIVITEGIELENFTANPQLLYSHDSRGWNIGTWSDLQKKALQRSPYMQGRATFDVGDDDEDDDAVRLARAAARKVAKGLLRACSIGFVPKEFEWIKHKDPKTGDEHYTGGIRFVTSDLVECSVCNVPAHPGALIRDCGGDGDLARRELQRACDEWMREYEDAGVSREDFIKALREFEPLKTISTPSAEPTVQERAATGDQNAPGEGEVTDGDASATEAVGKVAPALEVDATVVDQALDDAVQQMGEGLMSRIAKMFGLKPKVPEAVETRAEPILDTPESQPRLASAEDVTAAKAKVDAVRERLAQRGLA